MVDVYLRDRATLKSNLELQTSNLPGVTESERLEAIRSAFPKEGLLAEKEWLLSPDAFPIDRKFLAELEQLGHRLRVFQRACNQLYQLSVKGKQPSWVARYLDAGKPAELIEFSRRKEIRDNLPRVIRPDLILTESGYVIAEIDSVPGGIGLTGWLNQTYSSFDSQIIGGTNGMLDGFRSVLPDGGDIVISQEAATYRPEMKWMAARLKQTSNSPQDESIRLADIKHQTSVWRVVPAENYEPQDGRTVYRFFELFDLPHAEWEKRIEHALATFESSPTILQRFHKGRQFEHRYWESNSGELKTMKGRVRLCPYYFVEGDRVKLRGALATIAPTDKKFLHGMSEAILVPSRSGDKSTFRD